MSVETQVMFHSIHDVHVVVEDFPFLTDRIQALIRNRLQVAEYYFEQKAYQRALEAFREVILLEVSNELAARRITEITEMSIL